ncbi:MAG: efflux RND transporter periplasmic adaptor subunit [Sedimentisphaerales bacterium]
MKVDSREKQVNKTTGKSSLAKRLRLVLIFAAVVVAIGIFVFLWLWTSGASFLAFARKQGGVKELGIFTVSRGDLPITVTEGGDIKALNSTDIKSEVEGQTKIISIVDEGTTITPDDVNNRKVLVELDSSSIKEKLTQQEITFSTEEASYTEAKEALDIQIKQNDSDIKAGEIKVRFALMDLQKYLGATVAEKLMPEQAQVSNATNPGAEDNLPLGEATGKITSLIDDPNLGGGALQKLRELNGDITLAESKFEQASDRLMWTQKLYDKEYVAETELRKDQLEMQSSKIQMDRARTALELFRLYEFPKETEKLLSDYNEANRELERIEAGARSKLAQAQAKLDSKKATYSLEKERLEKWRKQLGACTIRAPVPGQVVYSSSMMDSWQRRNNPIEIGAEIRERQKIISIPDTSEMKVEIKIHETWVDKVQPGQQARITISAFPDKTFTGKVLKKAPLADPEEWLNPDLKVYSTDVSIDGTHEFLKTGMSAKVEIVIEELKNVISVPLQAVVNQRGKKVCYVMGSKEPKPREVETGLFNDNFVEIKSGLAEGEKVLLNPPRVSESDATAEKEQKAEKPT